MFCEFVMVGREISSDKSLFLTIGRVGDIKEVEEEEEEWD